jgi:hypothetical protein
MKSFITSAIGATVLAPTVFAMLSRLPEAIRNALNTRAEVSAIMAEAYRRQR